jgi:hypothetical protein
MTNDQGPMKTQIQKRNMPKGKLNKLDRFARAVERLRVKHRVESVFLKATMVLEVNGKLVMTQRASFMGNDPTDAVIQRERVNFLHQD